MAVLDYNEITPKKIILLEGTPYEVLESHCFRKQKRKPVNQTKLRNILTGRVTEQSFHAAEKAEEAELSTRQIKFLYENKGAYWFCSPKDPSDRFELSADIVGSAGRFLKANTEIDALVFDDGIISVRIPVKMDLKVKEAPPAVRGNTSQGALKQVVLETGATVNVPLFINEGDTIRVNTETGDYVERA